MIPGGRTTRIEPATALLHLDLDEFTLPAGDLKAFHDDLAGGAEVVPATVALSSALAAVAPAAAAAGAVSPKGTRLVHLPFWVVSFRMGPAVHEVWIDAAGGQILPLSIPASAGGTLDRIYSALLASIFVAAAAGFLAVSSRRGPLVALGILLLITAGPLGWWGMRRAIARSEGP